MKLFPKQQKLARKQGEYLENGQKVATMGKQESKNGKNSQRQHKILRKVAKHDPKVVIKRVKITETAIK